MRMGPINDAQGAAIFLAKDNIDTDQIIPARFLYRSRADGFQKLLFHDLQGQIQGEFFECLLNSTTSKILIVGDNFGCGSSREQAVWALLDNGVKAIVAKSYGDIFYGNAVNNGLLVALMPTGWKELVEQVSLGSMLNINLQTQLINIPQGASFPFAIDLFFKNMLLAGIDEVDMTLSLVEKIEAFEQRHATLHPWLQRLPGNL